MEAVSLAVEDVLKDYTREIVRLEGETRYETSVEVASEVMALGGNRLPIVTSGRNPVLYTATLANRYRSPIIYIDEPPIKKSTYTPHDTTEGSIVVESFTTWQAIGDKSPQYLMSIPVKTEKIKDAWMYIQTIGYDSVAERWHVKLNDVTLAYLVHSKPAATQGNSQLLRFDVGEILKEGPNELYIEGKTFNVDDQYYITGVTFVIISESDEKIEYWINEDHLSGFEEGDFEEVDKAKLTALYLEDKSDLNLNLNGRPTNFKVINPTVLREATAFSTLIEADVSNIIERSNTITGDQPTICILSATSDKIELETEDVKENLDPHQTFVENYLDEQKFEQLGMVYYKDSIYQN